MAAARGPSPRPRWAVSVADRLDAFPLEVDWRSPAAQRKGNDMSRVIRWGVAAGLALAASGTAWAEDGKPDGKATGGDVWYDEFYASASAPSPTPVVTTGASHGAATTIATGQHPHQRAKGVASGHARDHHRRLARSR